MGNVYDEHVVGYFDKFTPEYSVERYQDIVSMLRKLKTPRATLLDIGCGAGNILDLVKRECGISKLYGIDVSSKYVELTRARMNCPVWLGSIVDDGFVGSLPHKFDFIMMGAVLHHIVSGTRKGSRSLAQKAVMNSLSLLNNNGYLIIHEPTFGPRYLMDLVFYIKVIFSSMSNERISLFNNVWNNIGAPVVSYYSIPELHQMVEYSGGLVVDSRHEQPNIPELFRKLGIKRMDSTLLVQRK
jgi:SAM-dependent methyltransferase